MVSRPAKIIRVPAAGNQLKVNVVEDSSVSEPAANTFRPGQAKDVVHGAWPSAAFTGPRLASAKMTMMIPYGA